MTQPAPDRLSKRARLALLAQPDKEEEAAPQAPGSIGALLYEAETRANKVLEHSYPALCGNDTTGVMIRQTLKAMREALMEVLREHDTGAMITFMIESQIKLPVDQIVGMVRALPRSVIQTAIGNPEGIKSGTIALLSIEQHRRENQGRQPTPATPEEAAAVGTTQEALDEAFNIRDYKLIRMPDGKLVCQVLLANNEVGETFEVSDMTYDVPHEQLTPIPPPQVTAEEAAWVDPDGDETPDTSEVDRDPLVTPDVAPPRIQRTPEEESRLAAFGELLSRR